jgi:parallel beta-helix repeat protein
MRAMMALGVFMTGLLAAARPAAPATLNVATYGTDSASCGSASAPCGSINHAITKATAGDKIVVGPGRYTTVGPPSCTCVVLVDKAVTIESRDGALVTVIDADGAARDTVRIVASGVTFGAAGRGFTLRGASSSRAGLATAFSGIEDLVVAGNVASDNGGVGFSLNIAHGHHVTDNIATRNGTDGFFDLSGIDGTYARNMAAMNGGIGFVFILASSLTLTDSIARDNGGHGFRLVGGSGLEVTNNGAHGNDGQGFDVSGTPGSTYKTNAATGNGGHGFKLTSDDIAVVDNVASGSHAGIFLAGGTGVVVTGNTLTDNDDGFLHTASEGVVEVRRNTFVGNRQDGVDTAHGGITLTQNNIAGNGSCGLRHSSGGQLVAKQNVWGAASGPGADPADTVCNALNGSSTVLSPVATKPFSIPVKAGK